MECFQSGAFAEVYRTNAALGDYGVYTRVAEESEKGFADGLGQVVTEGTRLEAEGTAHTATGSGFDANDFGTLAFEPAKDL